MNDYVSFDDALAAVRGAAESGISAYDMCIAFELEEAMREKRKVLHRNRKAVEKMESDKDSLFLAARETFRKCAGGCSPLEAAFGIVDAYMHGGMDVDKARLYASMPGFATRY